MVVHLGDYRPVLAGSDYLEIVHGKVAGKPGQPHLAHEKKYADLVRSLVVQGIVDTTHDVSGGGLAVALAEMSIAGGIGMAFDWVEVEPMLRGRRRDQALFGECGAHFVVAVPEERWDALQDALGGVPYDQIGRTGGDRLDIPGLLDVAVDELRAAHSRDLFERYAPEGGHLG